MNNLILRFVTETVCLSLILLGSCKSQQDKEGFSCKITEYPNGTIKEIQRFQEGDPFGVNILFTPKMEIEKVEHYDNEKPYGLVSEFINDNLAQVVQYRKYQGSLMVNQIWTYDSYGNLYKDQSIFYLLSTDSDSVFVSTPYTIQIDLVCPPVKDSGMFVKFGNFDENYGIIDSIGFSEVEGINGKVQQTFVFSEPGVNTIRGIIFATHGDRIYPILFNHTFMVNSR